MKCRITLLSSVHLNSQAQCNPCGCSQIRSTAGKEATQRSCLCSSNLWTSTFQLEWIQRSVMEPSGRSQTGYYNVSLAGLGHVAKEMVHCNGWIVRLLNTNLSGDKEHHSLLDIMYTFPLLSALWLVHQGTACGWWFMVASSMFSLITTKSHDWHCCCIEVQRDRSFCDVAVPNLNVVLNFTCSAKWSHRYKHESAYNTARLKYHVM